MNTATAVPQKIIRKPNAIPARKAAPVEAVPARRTGEETTPVMKTPDYTHPPMKRNRIIAHVNVGWGNAIYLRGEGGGLSWDVGVPMTCLADDQWVWYYSKDEAPREIKFILNDQDWAVGGNQTIQCQEVLAFKPQFPHY